MSGAPVPSPVILLMTVFFSTFLVLPLGTWLLFSGRHDEKTRLWFVGILLLSAGMLLIVIRPYLPVFLSHQLPWILILGAWIAFIGSFRRELQLKPYRLSRVLPIFTAWAVYQTWVYMNGKTEGLGLASHALMMIVACSILGWHLLQLNRVTPSKNLVLLMVSVALYIVPNIVRVIAYVRTGNEEVMNVFKFSWQANLLSASHFFALMLICFGYWGFTLEKSERERREAEAGEGMALQNAEHYRQLIQERDQLLMMNSRFSVVSALSSFSAMLIHDISQPLQTLQLGLERMRSRLDSGARPEQFGEELRHLESASDRAGYLVTSLRNLMRSGESTSVPTQVKPLFERIKEFLSSDILQSQAKISIECGLALDCMVLCEPTMLQRIVINLVSNCLNEFKVHPVNTPEVRVSLSEFIYDNMPGVAITVVDNGGGFPKELLERVGQPWSSKTPDGMGLALVLSKQLVALWGGYFELENSLNDAEGAVVKIWLRQPSQLRAFPKLGISIFIKFSYDLVERVSFYHLVHVKPASNQQPTR